MADNYNPTPQDLEALDALMRRTLPLGEYHSFMDGVSLVYLHRVVQTARAEAQDEGAAGELARQIELLRKASEVPVPDDDSDFTIERARRGAESWRTLARNTVAAFDAHPSPTPAADADRVREIVVDAVKVAMKDAWEDHASDTGCWPADIKRVSARGPLRLMFTPAIWAQTTAEWAAETVLAALKSTAAKEED